MNRPSSSPLRRRCASARHSRQLTAVVEVAKVRRMLTREPCAEVGVAAKHRARVPTAPGSDHNAVGHWDRDVSDSPALRIGLGEAVDPLRRLEPRWHTGGEPQRIAERWEAARVVEWVEWRG
jgi:hypothetical protein